MRPTPDLRLLAKVLVWMAMREVNSVTLVIIVALVILLFLGHRARAFRHCDKSWVARGPMFGGCHGPTAWLGKQHAPKHVAAALEFVLADFLQAPAKPP